MVQFSVLFTSLINFKFFLRLSGSNFQSTQRLLRELFQRMVRTEQRVCTLRIASERLAARAAELSARQDENRMEARRT